jgi:hypothetical protein
MPIEHTLSPEEFQADTLRAIIAHGEDPAKAPALAQAITEEHFKRRKGTRTYWRKGVSEHGLSLEQRRAIYLEWWTYREKEKLVLNWKVSVTTIDRVIREGRNKRWERASR